MHANVVSSQPRILYSPTIGLVFPNLLSFWLGCTITTLPLVAVNHYSCRSEEHHIKLNGHLKVENAVMFMHSFQLFRPRFDQPPNQTGLGCHMIGGFLPVSLRSTNSCTLLWVSISDWVRHLSSLTHPMTKQGEIKRVFFRRGQAGAGDFNSSSSPWHRIYFHTFSN